MQSNIDFELAYDNLKARFTRVVNSRYFPKNILLRIWNNPLLHPHHDWMRYVVLIPVLPIILIVEILTSCVMFMRKYKATPQTERQEFHKMVIFMGVTIVIDALITIQLSPKFNAIFPKVSKINSFGLTAILLAVVFFIGCVICRWIIDKKTGIRKTDNK